MSYLSRRSREIREEESVPIVVRQAFREGVTVHFMGKQIDAMTAWRISGVWPWIDSVNYLGRGA